MGNYYTYAYLRENKTPYYIGKGKGKRLSKRKRHDIKPPKDKNRILVLKRNLTEQEAFRHEIYMIAVYGRKDLGMGILHNRTNGGEGASGLVQTLETKLKRSVSIKNARKKSSVIEKYKDTHSDPEWRRQKSESSRASRTRPEVVEKMNQYYSDPEWVERCSARNSGENNPSYGKKWWVNESNETRYQVESPGPGWQNGRKYK